jgi:hypothetical protein
MKTAYLATIFEVHARGKPWNGPCTIFAFISGEKRVASYLAGKIIQDLAGHYGMTCNFQVSPIPFVDVGSSNAKDERALIKAARKEVAWIV